VKAEHLANTTARHAHNFIKQVIKEEFLGKLLYKSMVILYTALLQYKRINVVVNTP
jgi:hypothetical protein